MGYLLWKWWYSDAELLLFLGALVVLVSLWPLLDVFFEKDLHPKRNLLLHHLKLGLFFAFIIVFVGWLISINFRSPEIHYQNALKLRYGNDGFPIDDTMAMTAFRRAADEDHMLACRALGDMLEARGDTLEAINYWIKAIKLGDARAARQLGDLYARGTFQNLSEGERLNSAYTAYFEGLCLGDDTLRKEVDQLRSQVSWQTHKDAVDKCAALKKRLRTRR